MTQSYTSNRKATIGSTTDAVLSVRLDIGMKQALQRLAKGEHRTLSSLVNKILADFVADGGRKLTERLSPRRGGRAEGER